jgi:hypothetical protein
MTEPLPLLDLATLRALAEAAAAQAACAPCAALRCAGWEALPPGDDLPRLQAVGSLQDPADEDPTLDEHHPAGTHYWSPEAPIAPRHFPYNRCGVWQCRDCGLAFLRYTEYGGYYQEARIRALDPARLA